eukprot:201230_1
MSNKSENMKNEQQTHPNTKLDIIHEHNATKEIKKPDKNIYIVIYGILYGFYGVCIVLGGSIYIELQNQLNVSASSISFMFSMKSIGQIIMTIIYSFIIDHFKETHRFMSVILLISSITLAFMPFIENIVIMYMCWISIGFSLGAMDLANPVYIFRLFPVRNAKILFIVFIVYSIVATVVPIIIQFEISKTGTYIYSLMFFSCCNLIASIALLFISTPIHDELRSIKRELSTRRNTSDSKPMESKDLDRTSIIIMAKKAFEQLNKNKKNSPTSASLSKKCFVAILCFMVAFYFMSMECFIIYVTPFCNEYLKNESLGRYLISCYQGGQLMYRITIGSFYKNAAAHQFLVWYWVVTIIVSVVLIIFARVVPVLVTAFIVAGFALASMYAGIYCWCELMIPINGILSCLFTVFAGIGEICLSVMMGELIKYYGTVSMLAASLMYGIGGMIFTIIATIFFTVYKKYESKVLDTVDNIRQNIEK